MVLPFYAGFFKFRNAWFSLYQKQIRKLKNSYSFRIDIGYDVNGKRLQKQYSGYKTMEEAKAAYHKIANEIYEKSFIKPTKLIVGEYLDQWAETKDNKLAKSTIDGYKVNIKNHIKPIIGDIPLQELTADDVDRMYIKLQKGSRNKKALSSTTIRYIHATLRKALNDTVKKQVQSNVLLGQDILPAKSDFEPQFLNESEVEELLSLFKGTSIYTVILLCVALGLRRNEALGLRWEYVDFINNTITIKKALSVKQKLKGVKSDGSRRSLVVPSFLMEHLSGVRETQKADMKFFGRDYKRNNLVCANNDGTPLSTSSVNKLFKKTLEQNNFRAIRIHDLRHTNASLLLKAGIPIYVVSRRLGHSNIQITIDTYGHLYIEQQQEAALKMNDILTAKAIESMVVHNHVHEE